MHGFTLKKKFRIGLIVVILVSANTLWGLRLMGKGALFHYLERNHLENVMRIDTAFKLAEQGGKAAEALRPIAGVFTFALFALGIIGTGMLAIPVLAGSAAYGVGEMFGWTSGLRRKPREARAFYAVIAVATLAGAALNFTAIDPIKALYWSAVMNGVLAAPLMAVMLVIALNKRVMGRLTLPMPMALLGVAATIVMAFASIGFFVLK